MAKGDVEIQGGGDLNGAVFKNAATESTLKRLCDILEKKKPGGGDKLEKLYKKALEENIEAVEESTDMHEEYEKTLKEVNQKSKDFVDTLSDIGKSTVSGIFSGIVSTGEMLLDFFKSSYTAFEKTNEVGAAFNYDLLELRKAAAEASMPLADFTKFISENSRALAALGGNVTEGAKIFSFMRDQFADPKLNSELYNLGFNTESLNKILGEQLKTEMLTGRSREIGSVQFTRELTEYTKDLKKLSSVTGVSTIKLQEGVTQQLADGRMMTLQNKLTGKSLLNFREGLALMNAELDPKVFDTLKNMMSGVIDPTDKFGAMLAVAAPGIMDFQQALGEGRLDIQQQLQGYERQVSQIGNFLGRFSKQQIARIPELKAMQEYLNSIKKFTGDQGQANLESKQAMDGMIGLFSKFGEMINRVMALFAKAFVKSGTLKRIEDAFDRVATYIDKHGNDLIKKLEPVVGEVADWFDHVIDGLIGFAESFMRGDLKPENIWNWVKESFAGAIKVITDGLSAVVSGLLGTTPEQEAQRQAYRQASPEEQAKMRQQNPSLGMPDFGGMFDSMASGLKKLVDMVPTLTDLAMFFGVVGGGSFVAGLGLAAGISAVATAMAGLSLPALAVGAAFAGVGYALNGVSNIINSVSDSFSKIGNFFVSMGEADPTKMKNAGESIKTLSSAMSDLAASGIVGMITGGTLSSLADTVTKFASIDYNKFAGAGNALKTLHEGLVQFTGGVMDSVTNFFSTDGGLDSVIKSLTKLNDIDLNKLQGVAALGNFFDAIKPFLDPNIVTRLPDSLKTIKESLDSFASGISQSVTNLSESSALSSLIDAFKQIGSLSTSIANANLSAGIMSVVDSLQKVSSMDAMALDNSKIGALAESLQKFNSIDVTNISSTISALNNAKINLGDNLSSQTSDVDNFVKSINGLVDSLKKLEVQLKANATAPKISAPATGDVPGAPQTAAAGRPMSLESPADDLNRSLNIKLDQMIQILTDMKNNTKDTADSLNNRRSAL